MSFTTSGKQLPELPAATTLGGSELMLVRQAGQDRKAEVSAIWAPVSVQALEIAVLTSVVNVAVAEVSAAVAEVSSVVSTVNSFAGDLTAVETGLAEVSVLVSVANVNAAAAVSAAAVVSAAVSVQAVQLAAVSARTSVNAVAIASVSARVSTMQVQLNNVSAAISAGVVNLAAVSAQVSVLGLQIATVSARVSGVEATASALGVQLAAVSARVSVNAAQIAVVSAATSVNALQISLVSAATSVNAVAIQAVSAAVSALTSVALYFTASVSGAVARTVHSVLSEVRRVKDFGATGDGTTDDTAAIQAAVNSIQSTQGGVVLFGPGRYKISAPIVIARHGITLEGVGRGQNNSIGSQIVTSGGHDGLQFGEFFYCGLKNISINGPGATATGTSSALVRVTRATNFVMSDVNMLFGYDFLVLDGVFTGDFTNITMNTCVSDGVGDAHGILLTDAAGRQCQGLSFRGIASVGFASTANTYGVRAYGGSTLEWTQVGITTWGIGVQLEERTTDTTWPEFWSWHGCKLELNGIGWRLKSGTRISHVDCQVTLSFDGAGWEIGEDNTGEYSFVACKAINNQGHGFHFFATGTNNSSVTLANCVASGNGQALADSYDGLYNDGFDNMTIVGGRFGGGGYASSPSITQQRYGINIVNSGTTGLSIVGTNLQGNLSGGYATVITSGASLATIVGCRGYDTGPQLPTATVTTLPAAASYPRVLYWVSNDAGGATTAVSNGTSWLRIYDNVTVAV